MAASLLWARSHWNHPCYLLMSLVLSWSAWKKKLPQEKGAHCAEDVVMSENGRCSLQLSSAGMYEGPPWDWLSGDSDKPCCTLKICILWKSSFQTIDSCICLNSWVTHSLIFGCTFFVGSKGTTEKKKKHQGKSRTSKRMKWTIIWWKKILSYYHHIIIILSSYYHHIISY